MPVIVAAFVMWFLALLNGYVALTAGRDQMLDGQQRAINTRFTAGAVMQSISETGTPPASINALASTPGFQDQRLAASIPWQGYAVSGVLNDGTWQYQRVAVFSQRRETAVDTATYLTASTNACGTAAFNATGPWCGSKNSFWWTYDTRADYPNQVSAERAAQRRILQKFARKYEQVVNNKQVFPNPGGTAASLVNLIPGYAQTATTCTGQYMWQGVPLDCTDLYSVWGTPRVYNYISEDYIAILATSTIKDTTGAFVQVASQLDSTFRLPN
jgi:hypothetical protein